MTSDSDLMNSVHKILVKYGAELKKANITNYQQFITNWEDTFRNMIQSGGMNKAYLTANTGDDSQCFAKVVKIESLEIEFIFNIDVLRELEEFATPFKQPLSIIRNNAFDYDRSLIASAEYDKMAQDSPIYVVPFHIGKFDLLVVDGNHRLASQIKLKFKELNALAFDLNATVTAINTPWARLWYWCLSHFWMMQKTQEQRKHAPYTIDVREDNFFKAVPQLLQE